MRDDTRHVNPSNSWRRKKVKADASWRAGFPRLAWVPIVPAGNKIIARQTSHVICRHHELVSWFILIFNDYLSPEQFTYRRLTVILRNINWKSCHCLFWGTEHFPSSDWIPHSGQHHRELCGTITVHSTVNSPAIKEKFSSYYNPYLSGEGGGAERERGGEAVWGKERRQSLSTAKRPVTPCATCYKLLHDDYARAQTHIHSQATCFHSNCETLVFSWKPGFQAATYSDIHALGVGLWRTTSVPSKKSRSRSNASHTIGGYSVRIFVGTF